MTLAALALLAPDASACEHVEIDVDGVDVQVVDCDHPHVIEVYEEPPEAAFVEDEDEDDDDDDRDGVFHDSFTLQYGMQFLPDLPGHNLAARLQGGKDAYVGAELRYTPGSDVMWTARVGAGLDVLGSSDWDFTLGLFLGTAGEWDRDIHRAVLYAAPIAGGELGFGYEGERLFGKYRLLAGFGGGPVDDMLTENEFTLGYKIIPEFHLYGQYLILSPGELDNQNGVGIGGRVVF